MGFVHVGKHVSKKVMHWRQNEINILINTEEFGFAHSAYQTHGTSVCDIAFRVDDAASTIERARLLGAEIVTTPAGRGELAIPAIKGVGGGMLRFVDDARVSLIGRMSTSDRSRLCQLKQALVWRKLIIWHRR